MRPIVRSLGAGVFFTALLLFTWLAPGPLQDVEIGSNTAQAGAAKKKKGTAKGSAVSHDKKRVQAALKKLAAARSELNQMRSVYAGNRHDAIQLIDQANTNLRRVAGMLNTKK